jgi:hypothetical protein
MTSGLISFHLYRTYHLRRTISLLLLDLLHLGYRRDLLLV